MLAIGLMSGTSFDGIDAAIIDTDGNSYYKPIAQLNQPYPAEFQARLRNIWNLGQGWLEVEKDLTQYHAEAVLTLLEKAKLSNKDIKIVGFHGQTIYHNVRSHHAEQNITWQIGNPHLLAKLIGIDVVSDFRRRDIACGGQGAPLVPIFHQCIAAQNLPTTTASIFLNIGGVANITFTNPKESQLIAFDTGPGNALINDAMLKYYNLPYDDQGIIASKGIVQAEIVQQVLSLEFFKKLPPKALDRNDFAIEHLFAGLEAENIIATLTSITARSIAAGIDLVISKVASPHLQTNLYICGGGAKNLTLVKWLKDSLAGLGQKRVEVYNISYLGIDPDFVEAEAFAYLAARYLQSLPSSFPTTTGVSSPTIAGVLYI